MSKGPEGAGAEPMTRPTQRERRGAVEVEWTGLARRPAIPGNGIGASSWWFTTNNAVAALMDN